LPLVGCRRLDFLGDRVPELNGRRGVEMFAGQEILDPLPQRLACAQGKFVPAVRVPSAVPDFTERGDVVVAYRIALTHHLSHRHVDVVRVTVFELHIH
jgi:hypothetical protein